MKNSTLSLIILSINLVFSLAVKGQQLTDSSKTYIHSEEVSFKSQFFQNSAGLFGVKKIIEKKIRKNKFDEGPAKASKSIEKKINIIETSKKGRMIWTIKPKEKVSEKVILYFHGGAYYWNISKYNWSFAETIIDETNSTIVMPDYPLAPAATCDQVYSYISDIYDELVEKYGSKNIIIMGESAGGGLALGFAMSLQKENKPQPEQLILLAPWLDVTMSNPDILAIDKNDKILGVKGLQLAGIGYAGQLELDNYKVSPIYGELAGLPKVSIFVGTHDVFCADARKLKSKAKESNFLLNYYEYPKMFHVWILSQNLKEAKFAISQITSLINN